MTLERELLAVYRCDPGIDARNELLTYCYPTIKKFARRHCQWQHFEDAYHEGILYFLKLVETTNKPLNYIYEAIRWFYIGRQYFKFDSPSLIGKKLLFDYDLSHHLSYRVLEANCKIKGVEIAKIIAQLEQFHPLYQTILERRWLELKSYAEIARELNTSDSKIRKMMSHLEKALHSCIFYLQSNKIAEWQKKYAYLLRQTG